MARVEHYRDPAAPAPEMVTPSVFALVRDAAGRILLVCRCDSGNWELPGGRVDPGESATDALIREVGEESGAAVKVTAVAGVYCDPAHVLVYPTRGEVRQQFAVYFHAEALGGRPRPDGQETSAAAWIDVSALDTLPIHPAVRTRLEQSLLDPTVTHIG